MTNYTQKPKFSKYQLVNYTKLGVIMAVTNISFHKRLKKYFYTLAVEGIENLEPLLKLVPESNLQPPKCKKCMNKNKNSLKCNTCACLRWQLSQKNNQLISA